MAQRILNIGNTQIVSGSEVMTVGEGGEHVRSLWLSVPVFASRPDITVTIFAADDMPNPGVTFAPWAVQYVPQNGVDGMDLIAISAATTEPGYAVPAEVANVVCSYIVIGDKE